MNKQSQREIDAEKLDKIIKKRIRTPPQVVTIIVAGPYATGKSFIKYEIAKMIKKKLGLRTEIEELEMQPKMVEKFLSNKKKIKKALRERRNKIIYKIKDVNIVRDINAYKSVMITKSINKC